MSEGKSDGTASSVTAVLARQFASVFSPETVARVVHEAATSFAGARIPNFIPALVHRYAKERLTASAQAKGLLAKAVPEVLFVCVHNAGRSQIAAAILEHRAKGRAHARCAGSQPATELHPRVAEVLAEIDVPLRDAYPKPLCGELVAAADVVVTMGCGVACPVLPGRRYAAWDLPDPRGMDSSALRRLRDDISRRVDELLAALVTGVT